MLKQLTAYGTKTLNEQELTHVRSILRADPNLWRTLGDVATWSRRQCLSIIPERTVQHECVQAGMHHMRNQLLQEGSSELECIIVEQIITFWLQVGTTSYQLDILETSDENLNQIKRLERRYNHDQARLTRALALLTRIRKTMMDREIKKYRYRTSSENTFSWERFTEQNSEESSEQTLPEDEHSNIEELEIAGPIPTSSQIPIVPPQIDDFIRLHAKHMPNQSYQTRDAAFS